MALFILLLSLLPVLMLPGPAAAQESELPAVQFGLVGLARLQTARLNVVNTHTPPNPIEPCHVSLQFLNELGEPFLGVIAEADLLPGQATLLDLPAAMAFQGSTAFRRLFRASVFYPNPGPPGIYGMLGLARLQSAMLTVINLTASRTASTACAVTLTFLDEAGQMFVSSRTGEPLRREAELLPGQFARLTLPAVQVFADSRELRKPFRASVFYPTPGPPEVPNPCAGLVNTLELVDTLTGRTQLVYSAIPTPGPPD